jgi:hypothetical protein
MARRWELKGTQRLKLALVKTLQRRLLRRRWKGHIRVVGFWVSFCDTEGWLLRRFRHPGMHKKPSMMLIQTFLRLRMQHLLMEMCLRVLNLGRGPRTGMILGDLFRGLRSLLRRIYTTLLCWIWPHWSLRRNLMRAECLPPRPGQWPKTRVGEEWCRNRALVGCHKVGDIAGWVWSDQVFD